MVTNLVVLLPCARAACFISSVTLFLSSRAAILTYVAAYGLYVASTSAPHHSVIAVEAAPITAGTRHERLQYRCEHEG
jgi:hypothetical protein